VKLKPGDTVRVVGSRGTAKIRAILTSMHGALLENRGLRDVAIQLETDARLLEMLVAILNRLAKQGVTSDQFLHQEFAQEIKEDFNALMRRAYRQFDLASCIDGFTFWGILEVLMMHNYDKWIAKPDRDSAASLLKAFSANLQRETKPKLVVVPVRNTIIENPIDLAPFFIVPAQKDEKTFVATLNSFNLKPATIRERLFQHIDRTTGYNLTHRPLVLMATTKDEHKLQGEFHDLFVQQLLPLLRVFDRQFPVDGTSPNLEFMTANVSERVFSGVIFDLEEGEMSRQGLNRMGGELLTGLRLSQDRMKTFTEHDFPKILKWLYQSNGSLVDRIRNSLTFFNRACDAEIQQEQLSAFIFTVIALESLFSRDAGMPLRATLADSVALLTESYVDARVETSKRLKKLYDHRSEIVHAGKHEVSADDLRDSMRFCFRSLFEILTLAHTWGNVQDGVLFEEIDRRKFN
jgi:Apea-like HEPN